MNGVALLVVDVQQMLIAKRPYRVEVFLKGLQRLIANCRQRGVPIIYVRHDDGPGTPLERGTPGWQIAPAVSPLPGDTVIDKKFNSAFHKTGLDGLLRAKGVRSLLLTGMRTEYCIDATCKSAFDLGYSLIIPRELNTTFENACFPAEQLHAFFNDTIWNKRFAQVLPETSPEAILGHS